MSTSDPFKTCVPRFPTTHWSAVCRAAGPEGDARRAALEQLLRRYWAPMRSYVRLRLGADGPRSDDLVQGFITTRLLEQNLLAKADPGRGRFRTFLLTALGRYVSNVNRDERAMKRSPGAAAPLESADDVSDGAAGPGESFDRDWANRVMEEATLLMRADCEASGRPDLWGVFEGRVLGPALHGADPTPYRELVARFGFASPAKACNALATAKRQFHRCLRLVIGEYEREAADVDAELAELWRIFSAAGAGGARSRPRP